MKYPGLALLTLAMSCSPPPALEAFTLRDGTVLELEPGAEVQRDEVDGRLALRGADGIVVSIQEVAAEERGVDTRTPRDVAAALAERIEAREREGDLGHSPCQVAGRPAECLVGWMEREGVRFARSGAVLRIGSQIVWLDVAGPQSRIGAVNARSQAVRASLRVRGS